MSSEQGITALLRQLGADGAALLRNEIALAKLELQDVVRSATAEGARIGVAIALAAVGGLAIVAGLILALGHLLHDHYATSAFIIGAIFLGIGAFFGRRAVRVMKGGALKPGETIETLQEDKHWLAQEVRDFKNQVRERSS